MVKDRLQFQNPVTKRWVKLDTETGRVIATKKSPGPFKDVPQGGPEAGTFTSINHLIPPSLKSRR